MKKLIFLTVLLFGFIAQKSNAQSTTPTNTYATGDYLGYNSSSPGNALIFTTTTGLSNPQMTLLPIGNFGIGTVTPSQTCSILGGNFNIDASTTQYGYMIGDQYVVWTNGSYYNIYLGVGAAGGVGTTPPGYSNTILGPDAGLKLGISTGIPHDNTILGAYAGYWIQSSYQNTYLGDAAGQSDRNGFDNTFVGYAAGWQTQGGASRQLITIRL
jgi:trimeric autotransporter adhesin